jgi:CobQ-like glutamine amidotransferase family enzyme
MSTQPGRAIRLATLYEDVMNVYADRGNRLALTSRAAAHGVAVEVAAVSLGDALPAEADLVMIGGGQDAEQRRIAGDLGGRAEELRAWADDDVAMLAVCGGFQLFGHWYRDSRGETIEGVGLFDVTTIAPPAGEGRRWPRAIGDVLATSTVEGVGEVVGFENHAGRTYLGPAAQPFARIEYGYGNNGDDGSEGARYRAAIGTYLHGSLLPKNPALLDHLLEAALRHRYGPPAGASHLEPLEAPWAQRAHEEAVAVARRRAPRFARAR